MTEPLKYAENDPLSIVVSTLEKMNKDELAAEVVDAFAEASANIEQWNLIAKLYFDVRAVPKAEATALKVLAMCRNNEERYNARANLAKMYNNINEPEKSLYYTNLNKRVNPDDPDSSLEEVFSLYLLNRKDEAKKILLRMKAVEDKLEDRHRDTVNFNLGTYMLEEGKFIEGLTNFFIIGKKLKLWFTSRELPFKYWDGGAFPGKTLILFVEGGGIGDEMILVRFMDNLKEIGFRPVYYTSRKDMYDLFNQCGYEAVMDLNGLPKDSLWTYFTHVPIYLKLTPESISRSKYLYPSESARKKWSFIKQSEKLKVGVRWQGNTKNERDLHRKLPLDEVMKTLLDFYGNNVEYYSLQVGDGADEAARYQQLIDVSDKIKSYDDTMALIENLDIVVTSCTSVLHAAAIVGTKTFGLIPISAYFTWASPALPNESIWYPSNLKIFKQSVFKSWKEPLEEMAKQLPRTR